MARISELHYSNAYASVSGVSEFVEVALAQGEDPADFTVSLYQANGNVGLQVQLDDPGVQVFTDTDSNETVCVLSADDFNLRITDPDGGGPNNYEAIALTETGAVPAQVIDFYDIGGGTTGITANDGAAAGAVSENLPVEDVPGQTRTSIQFNQPNPDALVYEEVSPGETGVVCFVAGGMIETATGLRPVEVLKPGDLVRTRDDGLQPLRWIGQTTVVGQERLAPIRIAKGTFGAVCQFCVASAPPASDRLAGAALVCLRGSFGARM